MTPAETYLAGEEVTPGCRWGRARKAAFLLAIGRWPEESAALMEKHGVSADELVEWRRNGDRLGRKGLQAGVVAPAEERKRALDAAAPPPHRHPATEPRRHAPANPWRDR